VIVFIIDIQYLIVLDPERQSPVARDIETPDSLAVPSELMSYPRWESVKLFRVLHVLQESQHGAEFDQGIRGQTFRAVIQVETFQTFMDEAPYPHPFTVARCLTPVNSPRPARAYCTDTQRLGGSVGCGPPRGRRGAVAVAKTEAGAGSDWVRPTWH
jgi:hypothetical protein